MSKWAFCQILVLVRRLLKSTNPYFSINISLAIKLRYVSSISPQWDPSWFAYLSG